MYVASNELYRSLKSFLKKKKKSITVEQTYILVVVEHRFQLEIQISLA